MSPKFWSRKNRKPDDVQAAPGERPNRAAVLEAVDICTMSAQEYLSKVLNGRQDAVDILNNRGTPAEDGWGGAQCSSPEDVFNLDATAVAAVLVSNREVLGLGGAVVGGANGLREARNAIAHLSPRADLGRKEAMTYLDRLSAFCRSIGYSTTRIDELWDAVDTGGRGGAPKDSGASIGDGSEPKSQAEEPPAGGHPGSREDATNVGDRPRARETATEPEAPGGSGAWPPPRDSYVIPGTDEEILEEFLSRQIRVRRWRGDAVVLSDPGQHLGVPERMTLVVVHPSVTEELVRCEEKDIPREPCSFALVDGGVWRASRDGTVRRPTKTVRAGPESIVRPGSPCCREGTYDEHVSRLLTDLCVRIPRDSWHNLAFVLPSPKVFHEPENIHDRWVVCGRPGEQIKGSRNSIERLKSDIRLDRSDLKNPDAFTEEEFEERARMQAAMDRTKADRALAGIYGYVWCPVPSKSGGVCDFERIRIGGAAGNASGEGGYSALVDDAVLAMIRAGRTEMGILASRWTGEALWETLQEMYWSRGIYRTGTGELKAWFCRNAYPHGSAGSERHKDKEGYRGGIKRERPRDVQGQAPQKKPVENGVPYGRSGPRDEYRPTEDYLLEVFWRSVQDAVEKGYAEFELRGRKVPADRIRSGEWEFPEDGVLVRPGC